MSLFQKSSKDLEFKDNLPEYVEDLLDAADLSSIRETEITGNPLDYGIDQTIELLQKLPQENTLLVVSVVCQTLKSANIDVDLVLQDAQRKAQLMEEKIAQLNTEVAVLKTQITQKETEIVQTKTSLKEILRVQELLQHEVEPMNASVVKFGRN